MRQPVLPFSADQFFAVFARYNEAIWPAQWVASAGGAVAVILVFGRWRWSGLAIAAILSAMWLWTGIAYHGLHFTSINRMAWLFGALFVGQGALLIWHASRLCFAAAWSRRCIAGVALILYAAVLYPAIGLAAGHSYPAMPMFGVTPCPVTIFTFGMLLLAVSVPWVLVAIPFLCSVIGGSAAILLQVPQDWALLASGPLALGLLWSEQRARR